MKKVLVLLSGGIDSSACIAYYLSRKYQVHSLFVEYGQENCWKEDEASTNIAHFYNISHDKVSIGNINVQEGYIRGRNAMLVTAALMKCPFISGLIALGIHDGTDYPDCTSEFVNKINSLLTVYENGKLLLDAPFLSWKKSQIIDFAEMSKMPFNLTSTSDPKMYQEYLNGKI